MGLFREAHAELLAERALAEQRVRRCRYQLQMYQFEKEDAEDLAQRVAADYRYNACRERLISYEADCERVTRAQQWTNDAIVDCEAWCRNSLPASSGWGEMRSE
jgi:hypothetical protein